MLERSQLDEHARSIQQCQDNLTEYRSHLARHVAEAAADAEELEALTARHRDRHVRLQDEAACLLLPREPAEVVREARHELYRFYDSDAASAWRKF